MSHSVPPDSEDCLDVQPSTGYLDTIVEGRHKAGFYCGWRR